MLLPRISIKTKLFGVITLIPVFALSLFLTQSLTIFEKDKIAYVYDSSLSFSRTKALQVRSEISGLQSVLRTLVFNLRPDYRGLSPAGQLQFDSDQRIVGFEVWKSESGGSKFEPFMVRQKTTLKDPNFKVFEKAVAGKESGTSGSGQLAIDILKVDQRTHFSLTTLVRDPGSEVRFIARLVIRADDLAQSFNESTAHASFLLSELGKSLLTPSDYDETIADFNASQVLEKVAGLESNSGTFEHVSESGIGYLTSYAKIGVGGLLVISAVERRTAMTAAQVLRKQAVWFFAILIVMTVLISFLSSRKLTQAITQLVNATKRVGQGDLGIKVDVSSRDEVEDLARSFNKMSEEVSRLLAETAHTARMEAELMTAKIVYSTLFPLPHAKLGPVEISGFYEPASECGGDWWFYHETDGTVTIFIGDATGHGVSAALLTSAAHAASFVASRSGTLSPGQYLSVINDAIYSAAKGKLMMTFIVAQIEKATGILRYSLASHEPAMLVRANVKEIRRESFEHLFERNNRRLGERLGEKFDEEMIQLVSGDRLFFYTDGVHDIQSPAGRELGERRLLKILSEALSKSAGTQDALESFVQEIKDWRREAVLRDDVTAVIVKYEQAVS
jgi:phosphoserine phosphatase RsbU/P